MSYLLSTLTALENQSKLKSLVCLSYFPLFMSLMEIAGDSLHQAHVSTIRFLMSWLASRLCQTPLKLSLELTSIPSILLWMKLSEGSTPESGRQKEYFGDFNIPMGDMPVTIPNVSSNRGLDSFQRCNFFLVTLAVGSCSVFQCSAYVCHTTP